MDWDHVHKLLETVAHLTGHPQLSQLRSAALKELQDADTELTPKPAPMAKADLKAAQASAPESAAQPLEPQPDAVRNVYEGLPGPAEAADSDRRV